MTIPTAELTIGEITKLQDIFLSASKPLGLREFIDAFRHGLRKRVDEKLMALLFLLIDADDMGVISWAEFQKHVELVRKDAQSQNEKLMAAKQFFVDAVDAQSRQIKELYHDAPIIRVFNPSPDGGLVTASVDGTVRRWDANTLEHTEMIHHNTNGATDAAFDAKSGQLVIANCDSTVSLYDIRPSHTRLLRTFVTSRAPIGDDVEVFRAQFKVPQPTPKFLFQGRLAPELESSVMKRYWEAQHSNLLQRVWAYRKEIEHFAATAMPATTSEAVSVNCVGDATRSTVFLGLRDGGVHVYNPKVYLRSADEVAPAINPVSTWRPHRDAVTKIHVEPSDQLMITCGADNDIHMLHAERGIVLKTLRAQSDSGSMTDRLHARGVKGFAVCKVPNLIASWGLERFAILWDPLVGKPTQALDGHVSKLVDVVFSPTDDNMIFTLSEDHVTRVWDLRTFRCVQQLRDLPWEVVGSPGCIYYDSTKKSLLSATHRLYWKRPINRSDEERDAHTLPVLNISYSDEQRALLSCDESSVRLWDTRSLKMIARWMLPGVHGVAMDRGGSSAIVEQGPEEIKVIHTSNGQPSLVLTGSSKPSFLAEIDHRYLYWDAGYWIIATTKQLLIYEAVIDQKVLLYPTPVFKKELWSLTSRIASMAMCAGKLVLSTLDGEVLYILLEADHHPIDPKHQPCVKLEPLPPRIFGTSVPKDGKLPLMLSFLAGPLHHPVRRIIVDANRVRNQRLAIKDTTAILDEVRDEDVSETNRVDCITRVTDDLMVAGRSNGQLSLWNIQLRAELFRFQVTLLPSAVVTCMQAASEGRILFVADDSGYVGCMDLSRLHDVATDDLVPCETAADVEMYARRVHRLKLFRADVGVISSIAYSESADRLFISSTSANILVASPRGERFALLGHSQPPRPPADTIQYELQLRQYRQELLMSKADEGAFTAPELVTSVCAQHSEMFPVPSEAMELLIEMCPESAERELERLMEKTSANVYIPLEAKPISESQMESLKRKDPPIHSVAEVDSATMTELWQGMSAAFHVSKQTKPFTRKIAGHAKLLEDLDRAADSTARPLLSADRDDSRSHNRLSTAPVPPAATSGLTTPLDVPRGGGLVAAARGAAKALTPPHLDLGEGVDAVKLQDLIEDIVDDEQLERHELADTAFLQLTSDAASGFVEQYTMELRSDYDFWVLSLSIAQRSSVQMFAECLDPERLFRGRISAEESRSRDRIGVQLSESAAALMSNAGRVNLVAHVFYEPQKHQQNAVPRGQSEVETDGLKRGKRCSSAPCKEGRRDHAVWVVPRRSKSLGRFKGEHATWRRWQEPAVPAVFKPGAPLYWAHAWMAILDEINFSTADSFNRKEARVRGFLHHFESRCSEAAERIVSEWREDKAMACQFQWTTADGVHLHVVSNPVNARAAGSSVHAIKAATREITALESIVNAQNHATVRLHVPLACCVRFAGLRFYCSAVLPVVEEDDELPWPGSCMVVSGHQRLADLATSQLFRALHLEAPSPFAPATVPPTTRRFLSKQCGRLWMVNTRTVFPTLGPQVGSSFVSSRRMRPEAVANSSYLICSRSFSDDLSLDERRYADRDGIKVLRNLETTILQSTAQMLVDAAIRSTIAVNNDSVKAMLHQNGLSLRSLGAVAYATVRVCSSMGIHRQGGGRGGKGGKGSSTVGILRNLESASSGSGIDIVKQTREAPYRLLRVMFCELIARTFRVLAEDEIRKMWFASAGGSGVANMKMAAETLSRLVDLLLSAGNNFPSIQFWQNRLGPASRAQFDHGPFADCVTFDDCDVPLVTSRISDLLGLVIESDESDGSFRVVSWKPVGKSIHYHNPFDEVALVSKYGANYHTGVMKIIDYLLQRESGVGPERWWLERHKLRQIVLQRRPCDVPVDLISRSPLCASLQGEYQQLMTLVDASRGQFEVAIRRLRVLVLQYSQATHIFAQTTYGLLADLYLWTGQLGLHLHAAETLLNLLHEARRSGQCSALDECAALKVTAKASLAIPADIKRHRAAREHLFVRFETLRSVCRRGVRDQVTLEALLDLALCHVEMEEEYEGIEVMRRALRIADDALGSSHVFSCHISEMIGTAFAQVGDFNAAAGQLYFTMDLRARSYPKNPEIRGVPHLQLTEMFVRKGDLRAAAAAMKTASAVVGSLPFDHPMFIRKLEVDSKLAEERRDFPAALAAWTKILDARERTCGALSTAAADAMHEVGRLFFLQQRYHESLHAFDVCLGIRGKLLGQSHPSVASTLAWLARSEASAGDTMTAVETFDIALHLFDDMCREDASASTFPKLKAQTLVDMASLLFKDVENAHRLGTPLDVKRLMVVGRSHQAELKRAVLYLEHAESLMLPVVQDPHHASIRAMRTMREACEALSERVTADENELIAAGERVKRIQQWAKVATDHQNESKLLGDALWYRKAHKIFRLKS